LVREELGATGCPLLLMVVSPAICGTVIARFGTPAQKQRWLPGLADGTLRMGSGIPDADPRSSSLRSTHRAAPTAPRKPPPGGWLQTCREVVISGVDIAGAPLIFGRTADARTGKLK